MRENPKPYERYRHFKGNMYQILCIAIDSEDGSEKVVYQAMYGDYKIYVRPLSMFMSPVDRTKYPDAAQEYRFERVDMQTTQNATTGQVPQNTVDRHALQPGPSDDIGHNDCTPVQEEIVQSHFVDNTVQDRTVAAAPVSYSPVTDEASVQLDPDVERFLDARSYEERLDILREMRDKITDDMIDIMSTVIDIEIPKARTSKRFDLFMDALAMRRHYEAHRLRS